MNRILKALICFSFILLFSVDGMNKGKRLTKNYIKKQKQKEKGKKPECFEESIIDFDEIKEILFKKAEIKDSWCFVL